MNKATFTAYLREPHKLEADNIAALSELAKQFPYSNLVHTLLALILHKEGHVRYESQIRLAASLSPDRNLLRLHIRDITRTGKVDLPDEFAQKESQAFEVPVQEMPAQQPLEDNESFEAVSADAHAQNLTPENTPKPAAPDTVIDQPIEFPDSDELLRRRSLEELKRIVAERLNQINKQDSADAKEKPTKEQIIEKFIRENPSISRPKGEFFNPINVAQQSVTDQENIVSETLARIYLKQGHIEKAVKVIEKLSLKYPEKSSYFASLINEAKKDQK